MLENLQLNQSVDTQDRGGAWQSTHRLRSCTGLAAAVGCGRNGVRMSLPTGRPAGARARMLAREEPRMCMHLAGRALPPPDALHDRHQVGLGLRQARTHTRRAVGTRRERSEVGGVSAPARTRSTRTPTRARRTPCCPTRREGLAGPIPGARRSAPECRPARAHSGLRLKRAPPATDARSERVASSVTARLRGSPARVATTRAPGHLLDEAVLLQQPQSQPILGHVEGRQPPGRHAAGASRPWAGPAQPRRSQLRHWRATSVRGRLLRALRVEPGGDLDLSAVRSHTGQGRRRQAAAGAARTHLGARIAAQKSQRCGGWWRLSRQRQPWSPWR